MSKRGQGNGQFLSFIEVERSAGSIELLSVEEPSEASNNRWNAVSGLMFSSTSRVPLLRFLS